MKKLFALILALMLIFSLTACKNPVEIISEEEKEEAFTTCMDAPDFDQLLETLPVYIKSVKYVVQDEKYKNLYPDMLQAVIQNNSSDDIKNAIVAFVAWDSNNLPVKIKGNIDFSGGAYIKQVEYSDINLVSGGQFGNDSGFEIDHECNINTFKAIVVSYTSFEGNSWNNPYYNEWCDLYEGEKLSDELWVSVVLEDTELNDQSTKAPVENITEAVVTTAAENFEEILKEIDSQQVRVTSTSLLIQDEKYKSLYPDMLQASIKNNSNIDIKNMVIAFAAWDENKLPVRIKGNIDFSDGSYVLKADYDDVNLVSGATFGENSGVKLDKDHTIVHIKAIVVSYEGFDGEKWENPCFDQWCEHYEDKRLTD